jgi:hypothetical protein
VKTNFHHGGAEKAYRRDTRMNADSGKKSFTTDLHGTSTDGDRSHRVLTAMIGILSALCEHCGMDQEGVEGITLDLVVADIARHRGNARSIFTTERGDAEELSQQSLFNE